MSAAFVLMITDGQDTQIRAEDLQQAGYAIGPARRRRADRHRKQAINDAAARAVPPLWAARSLSVLSSCGSQNVLFCLRVNGCWPAADR
jgi:hypothetical protein